ncbi:hypothetical protein SAMN04488057_1143 [Cyclobacterium lianum]|uniref:Uncharacterized protein n=1 Tax=Cyclobacterium lianum TaxID=388280 RepID=A0A1M7Q4K0_9BACT|nr:hypothetical protein SAMN04488057_1143 [Cyclobacterium lianum]
MDQLPPALAGGNLGFDSIIGFSQNFIPKTLKTNLQANLWIGHFPIEATIDLLAFPPAILAKARGLKIYNQEWAEAAFLLNEFKFLDN